MENYTLKFQRANDIDDGFWSMNITAESKEHAIRQAKEIVKNRHYINCTLYKIIYSKRKICTIE